MLHNDLMEQKMSDKRLFVDCTVGYSVHTTSVLKGSWYSWISCHSWKWWLIWLSPSPYSSLVHDPNMSGMKGMNQDLFRVSVNRVLCLIDGKLLPFRRKVWIKTSSFICNRSPIIIHNTIWIRGAIYRINLFQAVAPNPIDWSRYERTDQPWILTTRPQSSAISGHRWLTTLTHWGQDEVNNISQTTFSNVFPSMKMFQFRLKFDWSLFLRVQLTIFQHWFR